MSRYPFHVDEAALDVPAGFIDRSVNVLEWTIEGDERLVLVIERAPAVESLDACVESHVGSYPSRYAGYKLLEVHHAEVDGMRVIELEIRSRTDAGVMHHHQAFIEMSWGALILSATTKFAFAAQCEALVDGVLDTLRVRDGQRDGASS